MNYQKINLTKKELLQILQDYYKGMGTVSIEVKKELVGIYEEEMCVVHIGVNKPMQIGDVAVPMTETLNDKELLAILNEVLAVQGYDVDRIEFLSGLRMRTEGYGMGEHSVTHAEFRGVELYVKNIDFQENKSISLKEKDKADKQSDYELLIVVDMINGFVKEGAMADSYIGHIISANIELLKQFKREKQSIYFIRDCHKLGCKEFDTYPIHCVEGTVESEIIDELKSYTEDTTIYKKNSTCAIFSPNFIEDIKKLKNLKKVIITGCCTDICVMNLALALKNYFDQKDQRTEVIIPMDAVETYQSDVHPRKKYNDMAFQLMEQAGIQLVKKYGGK